MAKQHFLEILPFVGTILVLALFATVALSSSGPAPDIYSGNNPQIDIGAPSPDRAAFEALLELPIR